MTLKDKIGVAVIGLGRIGKTHLDAIRLNSNATQIAAIVAEEAFDYLDAPIKRVNAPDTPVPYGIVLEDFWIPDENKLTKPINEITS